MRKLNFLLGMLIPLIGFSQWTQLGSTLEGVPDINNSSTHFGYSTALSADGTTMVVGAPYGGGVSIHNNNSYVEVYRFIEDEWQLLGDKIEGDDAFHLLGNRAPTETGQSVSISYDGNTIAIGETNFYTIHEDQLTPRNGRVRIFHFTDDNWEQVGDDIMGVFIDNNGNYNLFDSGHENFGSSVKLSSDGSIVAIADDNYTHNDVNKVRIFHNNNNNNNNNNQWTPMGNTLYGEADDEGFGRSIDLSSNGMILAVGAPLGATPNVPGNDAGYVKIYEYQTDNWELIGRIDGLESDDGWGRGNFAGASVALSHDGSIVAFSGSQYRNNEGSFVGNVRVYQNVSGNWEQVANMLEGGKSTYYDTKAMVALSADGSKLAVGTAVSNTRKVEIFENINNEWELVDEAISGTPNLGVNTLFGQVLDLSADGSITAVSDFLENVEGISVGTVKVYQNCNLTNISVASEGADAFCSGGSTTLSALIEQDYYVEKSTINWYTTETATEPVFVSSIYDTPTLTETTSFWVEAISPTGCPSERVEVIVVVNDKTEPTISFSYPEVCTTETAVQPILATDFISGGEFYATGGIAVNPTTGVIDASNSTSGTYTIFYEVEENFEECTDNGTYEFEVTVKACEIQRGISPNGDNLNDFFDLSSLDVKKLNIYNRYGSEVYSKNNYTNQWGGQDNNDNALPTGTYFFSIAKNNGEALTGWVYINREK